MHITRGQHFREEINFIDSNGRPVFRQDAKVFIYLEYGNDVQKAELPFDGLKAVLELDTAATLAIPYDRLFYKIAVVINNTESILNNGIITIGA